MSKIKEELKRIGVTLSEFANKLEVSRPTLDSYIEIFESNKKIPKEYYQKIFEEIFNNKVQSKSEFFDIIDKSFLSVTTVSEEEMGYEAECANRIISNISREIKNNLSQEGYDEDMYSFIMMIIKSYRNEKTFRKLAKYFLILNGKCEMDNGLKDTIYISNYFKLFHCDKANLLNLDEEYLEKFELRRKEILNNQNRKKEKLKEDIMQKLMNKVEELTNLGIDIEDIDIKQVLNEIK